MGPKQAGKHEILLVDDDISHRTMLKLNLESLGYNVIEGSDGDEVLGILREESIDLILLDLKMQRMGGIETLQELATARISIPTIVITAFSSIESVVTAMRNGAYDYVTKPIDINNLAHILSRAFDYISLRVENDQLKKRLAEQ